MPKQSIFYTLYVETGKEKAQLVGHKGSVLSVSFSPDGQTLASGSIDQTILLWDVETGKEKVQLAGHTDCIRSVSFSPTGGTLASGPDDQTIRLWDTSTLKCKKILMSGRNETWLSYDIESDLLLRGDDGTFLTRLEGKRRIPILPPRPDEAGILEIPQKPKNAL